jgi:hypothetical protein
MQNRGTHIWVQPGRAGVAKDESNPMVRDCYSATLLLKKVEQNFWLHLSTFWKVEQNIRKAFGSTYLLLKKVEQNIRKAFGSTFLKGGIKNMSNLWLHLFERWIKKNWDTFSLYSLIY